MKKRLFIKNAAILTATALITRTLGILMRVYTAGKIGTVGLGLFSLVMTVFAFCVTVSTSAVHLACTRLVTDSLAENNAPKAVFSLKKCMLTDYLAFDVGCNVPVGKLYSRLHTKGFKMYSSLKNPCSLSSVYVGFRCAERLFFCKAKGVLHRRRTNN